MEPAAVTIARRPCVRCGDPHGKPYLVDAQGLDFNLAHSGGLASIALGVEIEVGIDIEMLGQATRVQGVAERFLAPSEQAALARLPEAVRDITCLAQWTRKEAWCKGTGAGLAPDLRELVIDPVPPRDGTRLSVPDAGGSWTLVDVILQGAVGTLAARPEPSRVWAFGSMPDGGSPEGATKR
jgi:4'-phosphopantetheinyl transferase